MSDNNESNSVGYGKPPQGTQFAKGKSGNPKGRPKRSQNLMKLLEKVGSEMVTVNKQGKASRMTMFKAVVSQLVTKAAGGDLTAIRIFYDWSKTYFVSEETESVIPVLTENDKAVIASAIRRIRSAENTSSEVTSEAAESEPEPSPQPEFEPVWRND